MIVKGISVAPIGTNCYIAACEKTGEAVVIDPGGESDRIIRLLDDEKFKLRYILGTHAHFDHVGGVMEIVKAKKVPFMMDKREEPLINPETFKQSQAMFGFSGLEEPKIDEYLEVDKEYSFGEIKFKVLDTPGHSPGGVSFLFDKCVFVGDTLFAGSIGRTDLPGGSMDILMSSIRTKLMTLKDDMMVYCGHMGNTTIGQERSFNPFKMYWEK